MFRPAVSVAAREAHHSPVIGVAEAHQLIPFLVSVAAQTVRPPQAGVSPSPNTPCADRRCIRTRRASRAAGTHASPRPSASLAQRDQRMWPPEPFVGPATCGPVIYTIPTTIVAGRTRKSRPWLVSRCGAPGLPAASAAASSERAIAQHIAAEAARSLIDSS